MAVSDSLRLWRKSSASGSGADNCVEVAIDSDVWVRDSKVSKGLVFAVSSPAWNSFLSSVKDDPIFSIVEFDLRR
ncbi:DUF397 domain-containing protein [Streptomyces sp. NPDC057838]|uniref:DUF397 domain-containing protein n=1 Tax=unclassified Streptomyces TaxID=2593676 RepID=UPI00369F4193